VQSGTIHCQHSRRKHGRCMPTAPVSSVSWLAADCGKWHDAHGPASSAPQLCQTTCNARMKKCQHGNWTISNEDTCSCVLHSWMKFLLLQSLFLQCKGHPTSQLSSACAETPWLQCSQHGNVLAAKCQVAASLQHLCSSTVVSLAAASSSCQNFHHMINKGTDRVPNAQQFNNLMDRQMITVNQLKQTRNLIQMVFVINKLINTDVIWVGNSFLLLRLPQLTLVVAPLWHPFLCHPVASCFWSFFMPTVVDLLCLISGYFCSCDCHCLWLWAFLNFPDVCGWRNVAHRNFFSHADGCSMLARMHNPFLWFDMHLVSSIAHIHKISIAHHSQTNSMVIC